MTGPEAEAGITYAELDIDISHCRGDECKTFCPRCHGNRRHQHDRSLSVNIERGEWRCHNPGCDWKSGLKKSASERDGEPQMVSTPTATPNVAPRPLNQSDRGMSVSMPSTELHDWALQWLDDRAIPAAVATWFGLTSSERPHKDTGELVRAIHFPYRVGGELVNVKTRTLDKHFWQSRGARKTLFGLDQIDNETIVVVEGEMDVLSCAVAGWQAVSGVDGAATTATDGKMAAFNDEASEKLFARAKRIIIAVDNDAAGMTYAKALGDFFGPIKTYKVTWPEGVKDANELLMRDGATALDELLANARPVDLPGIYALNDDIEDLLRIYDDGYDAGFSTGWPDFDQFYRLVPGSVTLVTGIPGHGKTSLLNHLLVNAAHLHDFKWALFSPEMGSGPTVLGKLTQIANDMPFLPGATERMTREQLIHGAQWVSERFWRVDAVHRTDDNVAMLSLPEILDRASQLVVRHGTPFGLVIDPWIRIDAMRPKGLTETEWVGVAVNMISRWSQRYDVATIIVAHPRKPEIRKDEEEHWIGPYDVLGSAYWYALADFIISVKRNKYTEPKNQTHVRVMKVREEGVQGNLGIAQFNYDARSRRFYCTSTEIPHRVGANPYTVLPSHLRTIPEPAVVAGTMWVDELF